MHIYFWHTPCNIHMREILCKNNNIQQIRMGVRQADWGADRYAYNKLHNIRLAQYFTP